MKYKIGEPLHGGIIIAPNLIASLRTRSTNWEDAMDTPPGWRLPTREELCEGWSSTESNDKAWADSELRDKTDIILSRAVRSFE